MAFLVFQPHILAPSPSMWVCCPHFCFLPWIYSSSSYKLEMIPSIVYVSWAGISFGVVFFCVLKMLSWKVMLGYHEGYGTNTWWGCCKEIELHIGDAILNENCEIWCLFCNGLLGFWNTHLNQSLCFDSWTFYTMYLVSHGKDMLKLAWKKWNFPSSFCKPPGSNLLVG
jgi:hypothetical protein